MGEKERMRKDGLGLGYDYGGGDVCINGRGDCCLGWWYECVKGDRGWWGKKGGC